ncbi:hypothetical protein DB30_03230 [Enhygromyxa salina]|uniref:Uncharacterized protein n=1 Tax=Enhygromyxa salina TaxID=215803 RepID=A0A0C1ZJ34_9BACT|nr:hypothetical protein [Enhygromyxa salina]KIG17529.1 hypothetical protein DB30_03230 [Enhygromyxa salina]
MNWRVFGNELDTDACIRVTCVEAFCGDGHIQDSTEITSITCTP